MKERLKRDLKIILAIVILLIGIIAYSAPELYSYSGDDGSEETGDEDETYLYSVGDESGELFNEDRSNTQGTFRFPNIFPGMTLFCDGPGLGVTKYMTAPKALYDAWINETSDWKIEWNIDKPLRYYRHNETLGLYTDAGTCYYDTWYAEMKEKYIDKFQVIEQFVDDRDVYNSLQSGGRYGYVNEENATTYNNVNEAQTKYLPFVGGDYDPFEDPLTKIDPDDEPTGYYLTHGMPFYSDKTCLYSLRYQIKYVSYEQRYFEDGGYDLTALRFMLTEGDITEERFKLDVQSSIWGDRPHPVIPYGDRGLSYVTNKYIEFYDNAIQSNQINKYIYASEVENGPTMTEHLVEEKDPNDQNAVDAVYEYKDGLYEVDLKNKQYVFGPFCINYVAGDITPTEGGYSTTDFLRPKEGDCVKVFDQDMQEITSQGGSYKFVYDYNAETGQGTETDFPESGRPFYVIVDRGTMNPAKFKGIQVKFDFEYLSKINGAIFYIEGKVRKYYYKKDILGKFYGVVKYKRKVQVGSYPVDVPGWVEDTDEDGKVKTDENRERSNETRNSNRMDTNL